MSNSLTHLALKRFTNNRSGLFSFWYIVLCAVVAVFAYLIAPDNSSNANQMHLEIHSKKPGFSVQMLTIPSDKVDDQSKVQKLLYGKKNQDSELPILGYKVLENTLEINLFTEGNTVSKVKTYPLEIFNNLPENYIQQRTFLLGTDKYGRDLLSRMLVGTRISFFIGFIAVFI